MEEYKIVQGYENYSVSNLGNVKNINTQRILKLSTSSNGYFIVNLSDNDKQKKKLKVSRLVAKSFVPNPQNKPYVDHIDNNRTNNVVSNLRWCSASENSYNSKLHIDNKCGLKGIYFVKHSGKFIAYITANKKRYRLGYFKTLEEAKIARQKKANELFGEFTNQCEKIVIEAKDKVKDIVEDATEELRKLEKEFTLKFGK